jgi:hypothetical protein
MSSNVNIYAYTAAANPYFVKSLAHRHGYEFDRDQPLSSVLQQLVSIEGEPILMEIIENNPDKDLFMDYYEKKFGKKPEGCTCSVSNPNKNILESYMNFSGQLQVQAAQQVADNKKLTSETGMLMFAGAILIAFAIITTKK